MFQITAVSEQGTRDHQEDQYFVDVSSNNTWAFLAVFDGHAGKECAEVAKATLKTMWKDSAILVTKDRRSSLRRITEMLNQATYYESSGCTMSLVFIDLRTKRMYGAMLGDSPIICVVKDDIYIAPDHNVRSNEIERKAAEDRGGVYSYGYMYANQDSGGLQLSRSLGDINLGRVISKVPETFSKPIIPGKTTIIVASDGVFIPVYNKGKEDMVKTTQLLINYNWGAKELVLSALGKHLNDNATAIVCRVIK